MPVVPAVWFGARLGAKFVAGSRGVVSLGNCVRGVGFGTENSEDVFNASTPKYFTCTLVCLFEHV